MSSVSAFETPDNDIATAEIAPAAVAVLPAFAANGTGGFDPLAKGRYEYALGYRYRLPNPAARKAIEYYRDPAHRGYLSHLLAEGEGPSLFFKTAAERAVMRQQKEERKRKGVEGTEGKKREGENRMW